MEQVISGILQFFNSLQGLVAVIVAVVSIIAFFVRRRIAKKSSKAVAEETAASTVPPVLQNDPAPIVNTPISVDASHGGHHNVTRNQYNYYGSSPSFGEPTSKESQARSSQDGHSTAESASTKEQPADVSLSKGVEQSPTEGSLPRSDLRTLTLSVQERPHLAPVEQELQSKNVEEIVTQDVQNSAPGIPKLDDSPTSNPSGISQISKLGESTEHLADATLPDATEMVSQVPDMRPSTTGTSPEVRDMEAALSSGRLRAQRNNDQWRTLNSALYFASFIVQDARVFLAKYAKRSDSQYPFYKEFDIHRILFEYLEGLNNVPSPRGKMQNAALRLNRALNKLDVAWIGGDPRAILFAVPVPFGRPGLETTPQQLARDLKQTLRNMKETAERLGYTVREESRADSKHPHRNHIFMLVRTLSSTLEFSEAIVEGIDEEDPDEQDGDSFEYAS